MEPSSSSPPARGSGLSLYASLLNPPSAGDVPGTITAAPVVYKSKDGNDAAARGNISSASLQFQPTKRPQLQAQKPKAKPKVGPLSAAPRKLTEKPSSPSNTNVPPAQNGVKSTLADWAAEDEADYYVGEKRERGGKKAKRKRAKTQTTTREAVPRDWDDIYDLSMPTQYDEYKGSDEQYRARREWKDRLYAHRRKKRRTDDDEDRGRKQMSSQFAPPSNYSFAPPTSFDPDEPAPPPPPPPAEIPDDATGEDAFARRMRMSQQQGQPTPAAPPPPPPSSEAPPPPPPPSANAPPPPPSAAAVNPSATISRAPVRYKLPTPPPVSSPASSDDENDSPQPDATIPGSSSADAAPAPRSKLSGQPGFAQRYMAKHGWKQGAGLGADEEGITAPLQVQLQKRKKKADAEGGGWAGPRMAKIVGGKRAKEVAEGKFGKLSAVVVLMGMVAGLDVEREMRDGELMMDIGRSVEKYGRVERVYIDQFVKGEVPVFVKFTDQVSALNAVNALDGWTFNGNPVRARFFDADKFANGIYE